MPTTIWQRGTVKAMLMRMCKLNYTVSESWTEYYNKCTVNQDSKLDNYPIPKIKGLLSTLAGSNRFTKLDMSQVYQPLSLDEESKKFTTINTDNGLYQYNRLPFRVSLLPGFFQRTMENSLQGIPYVAVRVDDILVSSKDNSDHLANLEAVLSKLSTREL